MTGGPRAGLAAMLVVMILALAGGGVAQADSDAASGWEGTVRPGDWELYKAKFVTGEGRVIDDANGGISHSESQGYGLVLAFSASDRLAFEQIWTFTRTELLIRDDGLAAWRWDPNARPHVTDVNNATDGDILIAYGLALAGEAWGERRYLVAARRLAVAVAEHLVVDVAGMAVLLPGAVGFTESDHDGGPVVNPSYYVLEAIPLLQRLAPESGWDGIAASALPFLERARFGPALLPSEWVAVGGRTFVPVAMPAAVFSYNAIRVPLYLVRAGITAPAALDPYRIAWRNGVGIIDIATGQSLSALNDSGYRILPALLECLVDGAPLPEDLSTFAPTAYYPSTLHLLSLSLIARLRPECR